MQFPITGVWVKHSRGTRAEKRTSTNDQSRATSRKCSGKRDREIDGRCKSELFNFRISPEGEPSGPVVCASTSRTHGQNVNSKQFYQPQAEEYHRRYISLMNMHYPDKSKSRNSESGDFPKSHNIEIQWLLKPILSTKVSPSVTYMPSNWLSVTLRDISIIGYTLAALKWVDIDCTLLVFW